MDDKERNESGRYKPEHSDEEFVRAVVAHEPAGTSEVADELGIARQGADYRLRRLEEEGRVSKKKVGNSLVWLVERE
jgi:predicted ArsR family transcriptional regulator